MCGRIPKGFVLVDFLAKSQRTSFLLLLTTCLLFCHKQALLSACIKMLFGYRVTTSKATSISLVYEITYPKGRTKHNLKYIKIHILSLVVKICDLYNFIMKCYVVMYVCIYMQLQFNMY